MGCACYDEGYDDGVIDTETIIEKGDTLNWESIDKLLEKIDRSPWLLHKVSEIFYAQGWILARKNNNPPPGGEKED